MGEVDLELVPQYGYPALVLVLVGAAFGLPLPATLLLVSAGAYASTGAIDVPTLLIVSLVSVVAGDTAGYWAGRWGGLAVVSRLGRWLKLGGDTASSWRLSLERWGGVTVFLTRFLLAPLGPAVNIVAGMERYSFRSFAFYDVVGEIIWVALYAGLGYALGSAAVVLAGLLGDVSAALAILALVAGLLVLLAHELADRHHRRLLGVQDNSAPESAAAAVSDLEKGSPA